MGVGSYSILGTACLDAKRIVAYSTAWHVGVLSLLAVYIHRYHGTIYGW
jgi:hypothetical protein